MLKNCMNKIYQSIILVVLLFFTSGNLFSQIKTKKFIDSHLPIATKLSSEYGIPVSIILGISILESGSGTSINARELNNYFGITGKNKITRRRSVYKQYSHIDDSFKDFCAIISRKKYYNKMKNNKNYKDWLVEMNKANYAAAKNIWVNRVTKIIVSNNLNKCDLSH